MISKHKLCAFWAVIAMAGGFVAAADSPNIRSAKPAGARLRVGDPAPALGFSAFLKGEPIHQLEKGKMYLLEFWATWCTPCKMLVPHLSRIARTYRDKVTVISVDVEEQGPEGQPYSAYLPRLQRFMKGGAAGMDYAVAMDDDQRTMARNWLQASHGGFPSAILVDREGRIAWTGFPGEMLPKVLDLALEGKLNKAAFARLAREEAALKNDGNVFQGRLQAFLEKKQYAKALDLVDARIEGKGATESFAANLQLLRYALLTQVRPGEARKFGEEFIARNADYPIYPMLLAMAVASGESLNGCKLAYRDGELALKAALLAYERSDDRNPLVLEDLASAYALVKDYTAAIRYQKLALESLQEYDREGQRGRFQEALDRYHAMAEAASRN